MGNHELYNFSREELKLHFGEPYYSFKPEGVLEGGHKHKHAVETTDVDIVKGSRCRAVPFIISVGEWIYHQMNCPNTKEKQC